jgi:hypothetical protein
LPTVPVGGNFSVGAKFRLKTGLGLRRKQDVDFHLALMEAFEPVISTARFISFEPRLEDELTCSLLFVEPETQTHVATHP